MDLDIKKVSKTKPVLWLFLISALLTIIGFFYPDKWEIQNISNTTLEKGDVINQDWNTIINYNWDIITSGIVSEESDVLPEFEISQILFNELSGEFVLEFIVKSSIKENVLVKNIEIFFSKRRHGTWWGWPLDAASSYNINFEESFLRLESDNLININKTNYFSYVRNYNWEIGNWFWSLGDWLLIDFEAPVIILYDSYTPIRVTIPNTTKVKDLSFGWENFKESESKDVYELYQNKDSIEVIKDLDKILFEEDFASIYIRLYTDNKNVKMVEWVKEIMLECWESWYIECEDSTIYN